MHVLRWKMSYLLYTMNKSEVLQAELSVQSSEAFTHFQSNVETLSGVCCTFSMFAKRNSKAPSKQEVLNLVTQSVLQLQIFPKFLFLRAEYFSERYKKWHLSTNSKNCWCWHSTGFCTVLVRLLFFLSFFLPSHVTEYTGLKMLWLWSAT